MTSGSFHSIDISSIIINRESRQRRELPDIPALAASLQSRGLINPILVQRETLVLIAGERRLEAAKSLGWTHIAAQYEDEVDPTELRALELEENIRRVDLPWQDHCLAIYEYHSERKKKEPDWTLENTGSALNLSAMDISRKYAVASEILAGNTMVKEAPKLSTAVGITSRAKERAAEAIQAQITRDLASPVKAEERPESIITANFNEWAPTYSGMRFNFIHCDFPYGIGADKFNQGSAPLHGGYSDTADDYFRLLETLRDNLPRLASDSCHILFWFSMKFYNETLTFFAKTPFKIDPFPLIWVKSDNSGIIPDPERGPRRIYETALFGSMGDRKIVRAKSNAFASPSVKDIHMSVKSPEMLAYFFSMIVDPNTRMLDPTCGSGSALRAAETLGASHVLGLEQNPEFAERARTELEKFRRNSNHVRAL